ncbi:MAG: hypothetical protein JWQ94_86 [Tardiphaga sp.]|nr:hypothetical protein [Tardiphaga sp.]
MTAAAKRAPLAQTASVDLGALITACRLSRAVLAQLDATKAAMPVRLRLARDRVVNADVRLGTAEIETDAQRAAGSVDEARLEAAKLELSTAKAEVDALDRNIRAIDPAIQRQIADLNLKHEALTAALAISTAPLRADAAAKFYAALQDLRDALALADSLDQTNYADLAQVPDWSGGEMAWSSTKPSESIAAAIEPFAPALAEASRAMRRLLR